MKIILAVATLATIFSPAVRAEAPRARQGNQGQQNPVQQSPVQQSPIQQGQLAEGHWISEKQDEETGVITFYENWFEQDAQEGLVHKYIVRSSLPAPIGYKKPKPGQVPPKGYWRCYAHDYIDGHEPDEPASDCLHDHYKGKDHYKEDAIAKALRSCRQRSKNKRTCKMNVKDDCWPESTLLKPNTQSATE